MEKEKIGLEMKVEEAEVKTEEVQSMVKEVQRERDDLLERGKELLQKLARSQKYEEKFKGDLQNYKTVIQKREQEMREIVKTLKQVSQDNKTLKLENERMEDDIQVLTGSQNPNYKIQLFMKIKEENNRLREEVLNLKGEAKRREEAITKMKAAASRSGNDGSLCGQSIHSGIDLSSGNKLERSSRKLLNTLIAHMLSLPRIDEISFNNQIKIEKFPEGPQSKLDADFSEDENFMKVLELVSLVDEAIRPKYDHHPPEHYFNLVRKEYTDPNISHQTNTSAVAIIPPRENLRKNKRETYFFNEPSNVDDYDQNFDDGNDTKLETFQIRMSAKQVRLQPPSKILD